MAYYCLHKLRRWPHEYLGLPLREQAFVIAAVQMKVDEDKRQAAKMRKK